MQKGRQLQNYHRPDGGICRWSGARTTGRRLPMGARNGRMNGVSRQLRTEGFQPRKYSDKRPVFRPSTGCICLEQEIFRNETSCRDVSARRGPSPDPYVQVSACRRVHAGGRMQVDACRRGVIQNAGGAGVSSAVSGTATRKASVSRLCWPFQVELNSIRVKSGLTLAWGSAQ